MYMCMYVPMSSTPLQKHKRICKGIPHIYIYIYIFTYKYLHAAYVCTRIHTCLCIYCKNIVII